MFNYDIWLIWLWILALCGLYGSFIINKGKRKRSNWWIFWFSLSSDVIINHSKVHEHHYINVVYGQSLLQCNWILLSFFTAMRKIEYLWFTTTIMLLEDSLLCLQNMKLLFYPVFDFIFIFFISEFLFLFFDQFWLGNFIILN